MENCINVSSVQTLFLKKKRKNKNSLKENSHYILNKSLIEKEKGINKIKHIDLTKNIVNYLTFSNLTSLISDDLGKNTFSKIIKDKIKNYIEQNLHFEKYKEEKISRKITISNNSSNNLISHFFNHLKYINLMNTNSKYFCYNSESEKSYDLILNRFYIDNMIYYLPKNEYFSHFQMIEKKRNILIFFGINKILFFDIEKEKEIFSSFCKGEYAIYYENQNIYIIASYSNGNVYFFNSQNKLFEKKFFHEKIEIVDLSEINDNLICFFSPNEKDSNEIIFYNLKNQCIEKCYKKKVKNIFVIKKISSIALIDEEKIEYYSLKNFRVEKIFKFSEINYSNVNILSFLTDIFPLGNGIIIYGDKNNKRSCYLLILFNNFNKLIFKFKKTQHEIKEKEFLIQIYKKKNNKNKIIFFYSENQINNTKLLSKFTYVLENI